MENLRTIAEVATAFTGFTGVVIVLGRRSAGGWTPAESSTIRILLEASIGVVFFGFLPPVLALNLPTATTWRLCAGLLALYHAVIMFRADVLDQRQAGHLLGRKRDWALSIVGLGSIGACAAVALGFVGHAAELIYTLSLLYMLFVGALSFAALLLSGGKPAA
jgi:hypothetical protein